VPPAENYNLHCYSATLPRESVRAVPSPSRQCPSSPATPAPNLRRTIRYPRYATHATPSASVDACAFTRVSFFPFRHVRELTISTRQNAL